MRLMLIRVFVFLFLVNYLFLTQNQYSFAGTISPDVEAALGTGKSVKVIIRLKDQTDVTGAASGLPVKVHRKDKSKAVIDALRNRAESTQIGLDNYLRAEESRGKVHKYQRFWIFNGMALEATEEVIRAIAARDDVQAVDIDTALYAPPLTNGSIQSAANGTEWNITRVQAPDVWNLGYSGQGIVVGGLDSGVDSGHPNLSGNYRGGTNSWHDAVSGGPAPYDDNGHGTRTMGIAAGSNAGGTGIGVAPGVQWIACKMLDSGAHGYSSQAHECFQWMLDPDGNPNTDDAPDVVNNSWLSNAYCNEEFRPDLQAWRAAGIFPVFAIGNDGPASGTTNVPGGNPESFGVGATDSNNSIASFSSRGPSCWGEIKPEVSAPGVSIKSANTGGGYATGSGTSYAAPHVAGGAALLLSGDPSLTIDEIEVCLENSALDLGAAGKDNTYGSGLVQLLNAVDLCIDIPNISVSPSSFDFGVVNVGNQSGMQGFTIANSGALNLIVGALSITGTDTSEFTILNDSCSNQVVLPSLTCTVDVVFSPATGGIKSANLSIPSNDPDTPVFSASLSGTAYHPDGDLDGDSMPNGWELQNGLNPYDPADAGLDGDLDGFFNLEEYIGQTDPLNVLSIPSSQTIFDSSMNTIRLVTPPGVTVTSFSWIDATTLPSSGMSFQYGLTNLIVSVTNPGDAATISITYSGTVNLGSMYGKYGPTTGDPTDHWYTYPTGSNDGDRTIILTLTDGQDGDHNLLIDGIIEELGGTAQSDVKLSNISTRGQVQTGDSVMIGGFIFGGILPKQLLIRARGPSLSDVGVAGAMANPTLELFSGQILIAQNDNWQDAPNCSGGYVCEDAAQIQATGLDPCSIRPLGCTLESAILITMPPGGYTAILKGVNNGTGVGIVEVFDSDTSSMQKLVNISTRGMVLTGDSVMIGGFIIGAGNGQKTVFLRARGPSLSAVGVAGAMANPIIELYSGQTMIARNDDWQTTDPMCGSPVVACGNATDIQATGLDPCSVRPDSCTLESAILTTLPPGPYTVILRGVNSGTGVGIVEAFDISP